jgi:hypothetical protein
MLSDFYLLTGMINEIISISVLLYSAYAIYRVFTCIPNSKQRNLAVLPLVVIFLLSLHYSYAQMLWVLESKGASVGESTELEWTIHEAISFVLYFHFIKVYTAIAAHKKLNLRRGI